MKFSLVTFNFFYLLILFAFLTEQVFCGVLSTENLADVTTTKPKRTKLKGVTIPYNPFVRTQDGVHFTGFLPSLMDRIAEIMNIDYELYQAPDGRYGTVFNGVTTNGMVAEVNSTRADFVLADLTITKARAQFVQYTEPYLTHHTAVLIRKTDHKPRWFNSLEGLVKYNKEKNGTEFTFGTLRTGAIQRQLRNANSNDTLVQTLQKWINRDVPRSLTTSNYEGVLRAKIESKYAMLMESNAALYVAKHECSLMMLDSDRALFSGNFGIALQRGSPYLNDFNAALRKLKQSDVMQELYDKYWDDHCSGQPNGVAGAH